MIRKRIFNSLLFMCFLVVLTMPFVKKENVQAGKSPLVTIESYEISKGNFSPGEESTISLTLKNTSNMMNTDSIVITMSSMDMTVSPVYGTSNQALVETLSPGQTTVVDFVVDIPSEVEVKKAAISFNIAYYAYLPKYVDEINTYVTYSNEVAISVPITFDKSFSISNVSVAETATVGATTLVSLSYCNNDAGTVSDVVLNINGEIDESTSKVEIGELMSGQTGVKDTYVKFLNAGTKTLELSLTYKDSVGRLVTKNLGKQTVEVAPAINNNDATVSVEQDKNIVNLKFVVGVIFVLLVVAGIVVIRNKKKY